MWGHTPKGGSVDKSDWLWVKLQMSLHLLFDCYRPYLDGSDSHLVAQELVLIHGQCLVMSKSFGYYMLTPVNGPSSFWVRLEFTVTTCENTADSFLWGFQRPLPSRGSGSVHWLGLEAGDSSQVFGQINRFFYHTDQQVLWLPSHSALRNTVIR